MPGDQYRALQRYTVAVRKKERIGGIDRYCGFCGDNGQDSIRRYELCTELFSEIL